MSFKDKNKLDLIPDNISDLCKFNFVNSINDCQSGKINFFLNRDVVYDNYIDLKNFENCKEGTILLLSIASSHYDRMSYTNSAHNWYNNCNIQTAGESRDTSGGKLLFITIKSGEIYVFT